MRHCLPLFLLAMLGCTEVHGQKCEFYRDEIDPITKEREIAFKTKPRSGLWVVSIGGRLHLEFIVFTASLASITDGASVTLLFDDDSTLVLTNEGIDLSDYISTYNYRLSTYCPITIEQLREIERKHVRLIRYDLTAYDKDVEISEKAAFDIREAAGCVLRELEK